MVGKRHVGGWGGKHVIVRYVGGWVGGWVG